MVGSHLRTPFPGSCFSISVRHRTCPRPTRDNEQRAALTPSHHNQTQPPVPQATDVADWRAMGKNTPADTRSP